MSISIALTILLVITFASSSCAEWNTTAVATIDGYTSENNFGESVAMTDNYAIVGAHGANKAFIFAISNGVWSTTAVATIDGYTSEGAFGQSVATTDNYAIVGAITAQKAFIFAYTTETPTTPKAAGAARLKRYWLLPTFVAAVLCLQ